MANPDPSPETRFGAERGNPSGRKHTKDKLSQAFLKDLQEVWTLHGRAALERVATSNDPKDSAALAKIMAGLEPKEVDVSRPIDGLSDDGLAKLIDLAARLSSEPKSAA